MNIYDDTPEGAVGRRNSRHRPKNLQVDAIRKSVAFKKARNVFRAHCSARKARCSICGGHIDYRLRFPHPQSWTLEHRVPVNDAPELVMDVSNWDSSHMDCNARKGTRVDMNLDLGIPSERW